MNFLTRRQTTAKISGKRRESLLIKTVEKNPSPAEVFSRYCPSSPELLQKKNKIGISFQFVKRVSPFMLLGFFLFGLFPYMFITGTGLIHNTWLLIFLFIFLEINVLYTDFALWNYFKRKKVFKIWLIEVPLTFLIMHFLI